MKKKLSCVLLIDDDEPTNYYNSLIIEETGCVNHVQAVQSGKKALEYLTNSDHYPEYGNCFPCPDLIFLDINMPAMNGWEFLDKYRALKKEHRGKTVLIMLTTSLFSEDVLKAKDIPEISGFESKPLTPEVIDKVLKKYFVDGQFTGREDKKEIPLPSSKSAFRSTV
jgi:CheY-like chemotaxis protein